MVGLCRAYQAGVGTSPGSATTNPAFSALAAAAGGQGIPAYCDSVLASPGGRPSTPAGQAQQPVTRGPGAADTRATHAPTSRPA